MFGQDFEEVFGTLERHLFAFLNEIAVVESVVPEARVVGIAQFEGEAGVKDFMAAHLGKAGFGSQDVRLRGGDEPLVCNGMIVLRLELFEVTFQGVHTQIGFEHHHDGVVRNIGAKGLCLGVVGGHDGLNPPVEDAFFDGFAGFFEEF